MKKKYLLFFALFLCVACDSGDIEEHVASSANKGRIVKLTATLSGIGAWESGFAVSLAGFTTGDNYAQVVRTLPSTTPDNTEVELVLSNLDAEINTAELAITNRLRERIITLASINLDEYPETSDTIRMDVGTIDVAPFSSLQRGLFNVACIQCHGKFDNIFPRHIGVNFSLYINLILSDNYFLIFANFLCSIIAVVFNN